MPRSGVQFVGCVVLLATFGARTAASQTPGQLEAVPQREPAIVTSVRVVQDHDLPAVEIVTSHPVLPTIQMLDSPPRLVIDLANARMGLTRKRTPVLQENLLTLRAQQFQNDPPITRIVLDLLVLYGYTWDVAGDTLMVRLKPVEDLSAARKKAPARPPQVMSLPPDAAPAVIPVTSGVGEVVLAGKRFAAGSSLTAGSDTLLLHLSRGGEVRVCPGTTVSVTPGKNAHDLMLGMSTGGLETHYALTASADTVLTPDFRILFAGPGEFDYAVSADSHGNTCVRGLAGNNSSAIVSELMGDRVYQVKPSEQAVFHLGRIDKIDTEIPPECGCPQPVPVMRTNASPAKTIPDTELPANATLGSGSPSSENADKPASVAPEVLSHGPETRPLPASQPDDVHIQVEAPLVFHAKSAANAPPAPAAEASALPVMISSARTVPLEPQVQPPDAAAAGAQAKAAHHGFFGKIKGAFSAIFH